MRGVAECAYASSSAQPCAGSQQQHASGQAALSNDEEATPALTAAVSKGSSASTAAQTPAAAKQQVQQAEQEQGEEEEEDVHELQQEEQEVVTEELQLQEDGEQQREQEEEASLPLPPPPPQQPQPEQQERQAPAVTDDLAGWAANPEGLAFRDPQSGCVLHPGGGAPCCVSKGGREGGRVGGCRGVGRHSCALPGTGLQLGRIVARACDQARTASAGAAAGADIGNCGGRPPLALRCATHAKRTQGMPARIARVPLPSPPPMCPCARPAPCRRCRQGGAGAGVGQLHQPALPVRHRQHAHPGSGLPPLPQGRERSAVLRCVPRCRCLLFEARRAGAPASALCCAWAPRSLRRSHPRFAPFLRPWLRCRGVHLRGPAVRHLLPGAASLREDGAAAAGPRAPAAGRGQRCTASTPGFPGHPPPSQCCPSGCTSCSLPLLACAACADGAPQGSTLFKLLGRPSLPAGVSPPTHTHHHHHHHHYQCT